MEHKDSDKLFRKLMSEGNAEIDKEAEMAKDAIWANLEINQKKRHISYSAIIALLILFLLGGFCCYLLKNNQAQKDRNQDLKIEIAELKAAQESLAAQLTERTISSAKNIEIAKTPISEKREIVKETVPIAPLIIEKEIIIKDTVFLNKVIESTPQIVYLKDTVFIENMAATNAAIVEKPIAEPAAKKPRSVEFVFEDSGNNIKKEDKHRALFIVQSGKSDISDDDRKKIATIQF